MTKRILDDNELKNVTGGKFTAEAQDWIDRNKDAVYAKAKSKFGFFYKTAKDALDSAFEAYSAGETVYDVADIKSALKSKGLDVDDLN